MFPPANLREVMDGPDRTFTKAEAISLAERNAAEMARQVLKLVRRKLAPDIEYDADYEHRLRYVGDFC